VRSLSGVKQYYTKVLIRHKWFVKLKMLKEYLEIIVISEYNLAACLCLAGVEFKVSQFGWQNPRPLLGLFIPSFIRRRRLFIHSWKNTLALFKTLRHVFSSLTLKISLKISLFRRLATTSKSTFSSTIIRFIGSVYLLYFNSFSLIKRTRNIGIFIFCQSPSLFMFETLNTEPKGIHLLSIYKLVCLHCHHLFHS